MNLSFKLITKAKALVEHQQQIFSLFEECFAKPLCERLWQWAFLENPCGEPIVSLCFNDENKLVGHYAVIPLILRNKNGVVNSCLSMTTMVHSHYRLYGVFADQAHQVYEEAKKRGVQLVIGFPNTNSAPGFKKRLGWTINESDYMACVEKQQLVKSSDFKKICEDPDLLDLDIHDKRYRQWRLSKPGVEYLDRGEVILKKFERQYDLVYVGKGFAESLREGEQYNILIDGAVQDFRKSFLFGYPLGYKMMGDNMINPAFKRNMLMSDVF